MGYPTPIEWTDATWNPIGGCSIRSPGCAPCYAQQLAGTRLAHHPLYRGTTSKVKGKPVFNGKLTAAAPSDPVWTWPERWRGAAEPVLGAGMPSTIFVGDMSDLLHEDRSLGYFMRVLEVGLRSRHIIQILTKRSDVLAHAIKQWTDLDGEDQSDFKNARGPKEVRAQHTSGRSRLFADMLDTMGKPPTGRAFPTFDWMAGPMRWPVVLPRIWLGFSAERQKEFDERWSDMRAAAAQGWTIFVSYEPAIGPLVLPADFLALGRRAQVIAGGMSGREAMPAQPNWFRDLCAQCAVADVPFFFKQWGEYLPVGQTLPGCGKVTGGTAVKPGRMKLHYGASKHAFAERGVEVTSLADGRVTFRVGKKAAGRLLDGREWNEFPQVQA